MPETKKRELRIAFAMGGGVSLGTFSGAALSEVLKLAVLEAQPKGGGEYDRVVVDVFSGASAGAMALAVMLRTLAKRTPEQEQDALQRLTSELGPTRMENLKRDRPHAYRDLIAAQVVQDVQERVWGQDITLDRLLGHTPEGDRSLRYTPSILDRGAVEQIACDVIGFGNGGPEFTGRRLLDDRVLFACSLSNITPTLFDARRDLNAVPFADLGLSDGLTSRGHRELRVFDLNFVRVGPSETGEPDRYPDRWCRYHPAPEEEGRIGDIEDKHTWAKIASTAIAAGAFPFAFGPVVLKRKDYEYGDRLWPQALKELGRSEYPFSYVDGGAFNNEPIREAFRLASVMDALNPAEVDRYVVFVDPKVERPEVRFAAPIHREFALKDPNFFGSFDGFDLIQKPSLDRLVSKVGSLIGMFMGQAQVIEGDKIYQTRDRFELRGKIRGFVQGALTDKPTKDQLTDLRRFIEQALENNAASSELPAGSLTVSRELERVIREDDRSLRPLAGKVRQYLDRKDPSKDPQAALWLRALIFVAVDLAMDLEGKSTHSRLLAIAPVRTVNGERVIEALPGGKVFGFGGFCSRIPGEYEMKFARRCAREFLEECRIIPPDPSPRPPLEFTEEDSARYLVELRRGLEQLGERVSAMIRQSELLNIPLVNRGILHLAGAFIEKKVRELAAESTGTVRYEIRIAVPDGRFELDGSGLGDQDLEARIVDERWQIITFLDYDHDAGRWSGPFLDRELQALSIYRDGRVPLGDRRFCSLELPTPEQCRPAIWAPNPIFSVTIEMGDAGKEVGPDAWEVVADGVIALEDVLRIE